MFLIVRRSQELLHRALGAVLKGWLMSDGYWAYRDYANRLRFLTRLLRKARGLGESLDDRLSQSTSRPHSNVRLQQVQLFSHWTNWTGFPAWNR